MMVIVRDVIAGLMSMLPNVMPIFIVFGGMAWCDIPVVVGTLIDALWLVDVGGALLVVALALMVWSVRGASGAAPYGTSGWPVGLRWTYRVPAGCLRVRLPVGLVPARPAATCGAAAPPEGPAAPNEPVEVTITTPASPRQPPRADAAHGAGRPRFPGQEVGRGTRSHRDCLRR